MVGDAGPCGLIVQDWSGCKQVRCSRSSMHGVQLIGFPQWPQSCSLKAPGGLPILVFFCRSKPQTAHCTLHTAHCTLPIDPELNISAVLRCILPQNMNLLAAVHHVSRQKISVCHLNIPQAPCPSKCPCVDLQPWTSNTALRIYCASHTHLNCCPLRLGVCMAALKWCSCTKNV